MPPGWYPHAPGITRYWDGTNWTQHTAPAQQPAPVQGGYVAPTMMVGYNQPGLVSDQTPKPTQTLIAWVLTVLTLLYMLPWAIAATRGKSNSGAIGILTLLLAWTVVGWIVALVMACGPHGLKPAPSGLAHYQ